MHLRDGISMTNADVNKSSLNIAETKAVLVTSLNICFISNCCTSEALLRILSRFHPQMTFSIT